MKSWMQAWAQYVKRGPAMSATKAGFEEVSPIQSSREVVVILASMALGSHRREARQ
jgi:hypothetical protein